MAEIFQRKVCKSIEFLYRKRYYRQTCVYCLILSLLCLYFLYGPEYLGDGATNRRKILHDGTYRSRNGLIPLLRAMSPRVGPEFCQFNREYL